MRNTEAPRKPSRLVRLAQAALERNTGNLRQVAEEVGASYSWICKLKQSRVEDPGAPAIERIITRMYGAVFTRTEVEYVLRRQLTQQQANDVLQELERITLPAENKDAA